MFDLVSIKLLDICLLEIGFSYRKMEDKYPTLRVWLCIFTFTFDWVGYDYVNRSDKDNYGLQKQFRIHYHSFNPTYKYLMDKHLEFKFGKLIKLKMGGWK